MKISTFVALFFTLISLVFLTGCEHTFAGMDQDIRQDTHKLQQSFQQ